MLRINHICKLDISLRLHLSSLQFARFKRAICNANIIDYHADSNLYASGKQLVCQFAEVYAAERWDPQGDDLEDMVS